VKQLLLWRWELFVLSQQQLLAVLLSNAVLQAGSAPTTMQQQQQQRQELDMQCPAASMPENITHMAAASTAVMCSVSWQPRQQGMQRSRQCCLHMMCVTVLSGNVLTAVPAWRHIVRTLIVPVLRACTSP
jgi:hypothetical protein